MGYTHYYFNLGKRDLDRWASIFPRLSADVTLLINASNITIRGADGYDDPILTGDIIALNGDGYNKGAHESFILRRDGTCKGFCKTAYKPYDQVVTAILIRATQLLGRAYMEGSGGEEISSDGSWDEWDDGRELVREVFPDDLVTCPWQGRWSRNH